MNLLKLVCFGYHKTDIHDELRNLNAEETILKLHKLVEKASSYKAKHCSTLPKPMARDINYTAQAVNFLNIRPHYYSLHQGTFTFIDNPEFTVVYNMMKRGAIATEGTSYHGRMVMRCNCFEEFKENSDDVIRVIKKVA